MDIPTITMPETSNGKPKVIFSIPGDVDIKVAPNTKIIIPANMAIICGFTEVLMFLVSIKRRCVICYQTHDVYKNLKEKKISAQGKS